MPKAKGGGQSMPLVVVESVSVGQCKKRSHCFNRIPRVPSGSPGGKFNSAFI